MSNPWEDYAQPSKDSAPWEDYGTSNASPTAEQPQQNGFLSNVSNDLWKRSTNIAGQQNTNMPERVLRSAGQVAGGVGDVIGEGVKAVIPDSVQQAVGEKFKQFSQTDTGKWWLDKIQQGATTYNKFKQRHPDLAADFEAGVNIASILPMGKAAKATEQGVEALGRTGTDIVGSSVRYVPEMDRLVKTALRKTPEQLEKELTNAVVERLPKTGIKATNVKNQAHVQAFNDASTKAVKYISENKGELGVLDRDGNMIEGHPTNVDEFSQAIQGGKKKIWNEQIQPLLDKVGNPTFSTKPIVDDLEKIISPQSKRFASLQRHFPDAVNEIQRMIDSYKSQAVMKFEQLEPELQIINKKLKALSKGVNEKMAVDDEALLTVASHLRSIEDKFVMGVEGGGQGIQDAKKTWGALKHIEESVARKANFVAGKKYSQGFLGNGYLGATSTAEMALGIATGNPKTIAASVLTRVAAKISSQEKDPNQIIKNMFKSAGNTVEKQKVSNYFYNPKSKMFGNQEAQGFIDAVKQGTPAGATSTVLQTTNPERTREWGE